MGNPKGRDTFGDKGRQRHAHSIEIRRARAIARAKAIAPTLQQLRASGITSATGIAKALNQQGIATALGKRWTARSIINLQQLLQNAPKSL